ncbi:BlaI/MecI/CopY family transcriptional regulator [Nitrospirillum viridazoti]|uniref:Transcriptional regulator n=1 Tax=Nitrospirillum amazonense TaxID=28077 RepID=A0A560I434_9PROT|nr:BlaI/MecI/CopY family transcriptional regulator [Nitrospirillum amazonense]TWB52719.1 putative transcriptional regulator [Nitrospirillum amazonense]
MGGNEDAGMDAVPGLADHNPSDLGDLEREVMSLVWQRGPITADAVREGLSRPLKDSTIRTVLKRLEEKGYLTHAVEGRTFLYRAAEGRGRVAARAVKRIVDWFCNGSVGEVLVGMVEADMLDAQELDALAAKIDRARKAAREAGK